MSIKLENYTFEGPYANTAKLKNQSGVYVIYGNDDNGNSWTRIDVGESATVKTRIESHDRKDCWTKQGFKYLAVAVLYTDEPNRMKIEKEIRSQKPLPCGNR